MERTATAVGLPSRTEVDGFLPLYFRTYPEGLDRSIRLFIRDGQTQLLEFVLSLDLMALRGFKIVTAKRLSFREMVGPDQQEERGLPVLSLPTGVSVAGNPLPQADLALGFAVFVGLDTVEVQFDGFSSFDRSIRHGDAQFLVLTTALPGYGSIL